MLAHKVLKLNNIFMAIAFDSATNGSSTGSGTSLTFAFNNVAGDLVVVSGRGSTVSDKWTGVTYNGVAMTRLYGAQLQPGDRWFYTYYLLSPATGSNNVVISSSSADFIDGCAASYSGTKQTGFPDAQIQNNQATGTPNNNTLTTTVANCWHIMGVGAASGTPAAGTSTTRRAIQGNSAIMDGNSAIVSPGSNTISADSYNGSFGSITQGFSVAPYTAGTVTPLLSLLGVGT